MVYVTGPNDDRDKVCLFAKEMRQNGFKVLTAEDAEEASFKKHGRFHQLLDCEAIVFTAGWSSCPDAIKEHQLASMFRMRIVVPVGEERPQDGGSTEVVSLEFEEWHNGN